MSNQLKVDQISAIQGLLERGWKQRRIARELGVSRTTVGRYARQLQSADSNWAKVTPGSPPRSASNCAKVTPGSSRGMSHCEGFRDQILRMIDQGLSAKRIHQDLVSDHDFSSSYQSVKRFVRRVCESSPLPFRRLETLPGKEAQIDFGQGALTRRGKSFRRPHLFRMVLSCSRRAYSEVVWTQSTEDFIRCCENAFRFFGGVPETIVIDNLKAGVIKADWFDPEINPKFASFAEHYGVIVLPTKPRTPRHKGKVEAGVKYCQDNALKGRRFETIEEQNQYLMDWELKVADTRIHGTTQRQVRQVFLEEEKGHLMSLPPTRFPLFKEAERKVHRDGHVAIENSFYSVPPEHVGRSLWVRWDERLVRVFNHRMEQIAIHTKVRAGAFCTDPNHIPDEKICGFERGEDYMLSRARKIGAHACQWAEQLLKNRGVLGLRAIQGLLSLTTKHSSDEIDRACRIALSHDAFRVKTLRTLLKRNEGEQLHFMEDHPVIREMEEYGDLVTFVPWPDERKEKGQR